MSMSFGQAMERRARNKDTELAQQWDRNRIAWQKLEDDYALGVGALGNNAAQSPQGLKPAAKPPTFFGKGTPEQNTIDGNRQPEPMGGMPQSSVFKNSANTYSDTNTAGSTFLSQPTAQSTAQSTVQPTTGSVAMTDDQWNQHALGLFLGGLIGKDKKPVDQPKPPQTPPRPEMLGTGKAREAAELLRPGARQKQLEEQLRAQGLRRGTNCVKKFKLGTEFVYDNPEGVNKVVDPTGNGHPAKDSVPAKLAQGEAVVNAGGMEIPGMRDFVAFINEVGAEKLGLKGAAKTKGGVLHAYIGEEYVNKAKDWAKNAWNNRGIPKQPSTAGYRVDIDTDNVDYSNAGKKSGFTINNPAKATEIWEKSRPMSTTERIINLGAKVGGKGSVVATGLTKAAVNPATIVATSPLWPIMGGRELAEKQSGIKNNQVYGSTLGASVGGLKQTGKYIDQGEYLNAAAQLGLTSFDTLAGFMDDSIVKPMSIVGEAMATPFGYKRPVQKRGVKTSNQTITDEEAAMYRGMDAGSKRAPGDVALVPVPAGYSAPTLTPQQLAEQAAVERNAQIQAADEAAYSQFFNKQGITDKMRSAAPSYRSGDYGNVPMTDEQVMGLRAGAENNGPLARMEGTGGNVIYRRGNEYIGMGAPSRIAAEEARANDPAVKRAAAMEQLREYGMAGNKEAAAMYNAMIQQDSYANTAAGKVEEERIKAQATAIGKGDDNHYKLMKDAADKVKFFGRDTENKPFEDSEKQARFNSFWAYALAKEQNRALREEGQAGYNELMRDLNDPTLVAAWIEQMKVQFELAEKFGQNYGREMTSPITSVERVDDLTMADSRGIFKGRDGRHSLTKALWDNLPFTAKGGYRVSSQMTPEFGKEPQVVDMIVPGEDGSIAQGLGSQQAALLAQLMDRSK